MTKVITDLPEFHMKHLLKEEVEVLEKESSFIVDCCVLGYHNFKMFWEAPVSVILIAKHEVDPQKSIYDNIFIALVNSDLVTIGHFPKFIFKLT